MPVVLAFDTAGSACSVAAGRDTAVLAHERQEMRYGQAEALLPMIDRVAGAAGLASTDIDVIAVSTGPGGFTGIRAGLAAAQGLALATGERLVGVTSFAAVAALVARADTPLLVTLDSRRSDPYVQLFGPTGAPIDEPMVVPLDGLSARVGAAIGIAGLRIAGDAAEAAAAALSRHGDVEILGGTAPDALGVLAAALQQLTDASDIAPRPLYLRPPDVSFPRARP